MKKRKQKTKDIYLNDASKMLEIYPKTKAVYDYIKEHPKTDAREIANSMNMLQVYTHVNRLEDNMLVSVEVQRERHYFVKHYTAIEPTIGQKSKAPQQQGTEPDVQKSVQTRMKTITDDEYEKIFNECLFDDLNEEITNPNFLFNIGGVDCFAGNSIVAVAGKPGVGKSTAMAILAGVLIGGKDFGIIRCKKKATNILWIDTEKDKFSCKQRMKTLRCVAKLDTDRSLTEQGINFLCTKAKSIDQRFTLLKKISEDNSQKHIYDAIFIDGIFDLTEDPGKIKGVLPIMELLKDLSSGSAVFAMLHTNKQTEDNNMREVVGTELQRICTNRITITCDKDGKHHILHEKSNDTKIAPKVGFVYDEDGTARPVSEEKKPNPKSQTPKKDFENILKGGLQMTSTELVNALMSKSNIKERAAKERLNVGKKNGIIDKNEEGKYYLVNLT